MEKASLLVMIGLVVHWASAQQSDWLVIIGGKNDQDGVLNTYEFYNWRDNANCAGGNLTFPIRAHTGAVINEFPIFCGGHNTLNENSEPTLTCVAYKTKQDIWERTSDLLRPVAHVSSTYIDKKGWFIFGGSRDLHQDAHGSGDNKSLMSQNLDSIVSSWKPGPFVYGTNQGEGQCVLQINETTTLFVGGPNGHKNIFMYDWLKDRTAILKLEIKDERDHSVCAVLKGEKEVPFVLVAGGEKAKGSFLWNSESDTIEELLNALPHEEGDDTPSLSNAAMVAINDGKEALLFGGNNFSDVWKFSLAAKTWQKVGSMLQPRQEHVVVPVPGFTCNA